MLPQNDLFSLFKGKWYHVLSLVCKQHWGVCLVKRLGHLLPRVPQGLMLYSGWFPPSVRIQKEVNRFPSGLDGCLCTAVRIIKVDLADNLLNTEPDRM